MDGFKERLPLLLTVLGGIGILAGLVGAFFVVPEEAVSGFSQKIFYFHVPVAETSFISFAVLAIAGAGYLITKKQSFDVVAMTAAEVGFVFGILVMITGMVWTRAAWGVWWSWEPRLTTYLILLVFIAGYFLLRSSVEDEGRRARFSAVFGIIAFINVPISFFATSLIPRPVHPPLLIFKGDLPTSFLATFIIAQLGMLAFAAGLMIVRSRLESMRQDLETVKQSLGG